MNPILTSILTIHGMITYITLCNSSGAFVTISTLGAGIVSVCVPDNKGNLEDIALGYANAEDYFNDGPCMGKIPGRYANRIGYGRFPLEGNTVQLPVNLPPHTLHGGFEAGVQNKIWTIDSVSSDRVVLSLLHPDGEGGFPGNLSIKATYTWNEDNELSLNMEAETDSPTIVNLTSHAYFNLKGHNAGDATDHLLQLNASKYLETDATLLPTGKLIDVKGTPMDFTTPRRIRERITDDYEPLKHGKGYDHCFVADGYEPGKINLLATLSEPTSGRSVEIYTNQPGAQLYTANWLTGCPAAKDGGKYEDYDGVAIEPQDFPDAPNHPEFPPVTLKPGEKYSRDIIFKFKTNR